jgi:hypothetical protein
MDIVNENSTRDIEVSFTDPAGVACTPESGSYKLTDEDSLEVIVEETDLVFEDSTITITIQADENIILNADNEYEIRVLTIKWFYSGGREENEEYKFKVKNLLGVEESEFN